MSRGSGRRSEQGGELTKLCSKHVTTGLSILIPYFSRATLPQLTCRLVWPVPRCLHKDTMPELPEVETARAYVEKFCSGSTIVKCNATEQGGGPVSYRIM